MRPDRAAWRRLLLRARPLAPRRTAHGGGWLILAPHPDDETLGAGQLIASLAAARVDATVLFVTDGSASHVGAPGWSRRRIAAVRAGEARAALRMLGHPGAPVRLDWPDAAPLAPGSRGHEAVVRRIVALCRRRRLRHVVASWPDDPHCDHQAAALLAQEVARRIGVRPRFYGVWGWTLPALDRRLAGIAASAVRLTGRPGRGRRALACHRTQLGSRIHGAREAFVLPRAMRRLVDLPFTLLLEQRHAA